MAGEYFMISETTTGAMPGDPAEPLFPMGEADEQAGPVALDPEELPTDEEERALVSDLATWCRETKEFWQPVHDKIRREVKFNAGVQWDSCEDQYTANVTRRLVSQKVANIYAKNPKTVSRTRPQLAFVLWDQTQESLAMANMAKSDPMVQARAMMGDPAAQQALLQAEAILADYQNGMTRKEMLKRWGRTLELVYDHQCDQQVPSFKASMKSLVKRALTARVGWVKLGYRRPEEAANTSGTQANAAELVRTLGQKLNEIAGGESECEDKLRQEVELMGRGLQQQAASGAAKLVDEGLVFDFPKATAILVDPACTNLRGFVGATRVAQEFILTPEEVERRYGVDVKCRCTAYNRSGSEAENQAKWGGEEAGWPDKACVCVWEIYDIQTQMKYVVCDGYEAFLDEPEMPTPKLTRFWPIFALTFNDIEVEENLPEEDVTIFAPSDVRLMWHMQMELNRSREALRDHRIQNRPLYAAGHQLTENDAKVLASGHPSGYCVRLEGLTPGMKVGEILQQVEKHQLDPAVYQTQHLTEDILTVVGAQQANLGPTSGATATETSVAEGSRIQSGSSDVDDLDELLTDLARAGGEMLMQEMPAEMVKRIVGPGAAWPGSPTEANNSELWLESEASGSGRPNKALEVSNFQMLAPLLMQIPGISAEFLAREGIKRLDDRLELEDVFNPQLPSVQAQNAGPGPEQAGAAMAQDEGKPGAQETKPGMAPPNANSPGQVEAKQSPTTQGMPSAFQTKTAAAAAQPTAR
jgi:hypothetical protein